MFDFTVPLRHRKRPLVRGVSIAGLTGHFHMKRTASCLYLVVLPDMRSPETARYDRRRLDRLDTVKAGNTAECDVYNVSTADQMASDSQPS